MGACVVPCPGTAVTPSGLRAHGLEEAELAGVVDLDDHGALDGVMRTGCRIGHVAGDTLELLDTGHGLHEGIAILGQVASDGPHGLDRLEHEVGTVPGQRGHVVRGLFVELGVLVDKFLGLALGAGGGVVGDEEVALAVVAAQAHEVARAPGIAAQDRLVEAHGLGLLHDQRHLIVILGHEKHIGTGLHDVVDLSGEVHILGGKGLESHHRAGTVDLFEGGLEILGQALRVVGGDVVEHGGFFCLELLGGELGGRGSLEGIHEAAAEDVGAFLGRIGVGGPGGHHRGFEVVGGFAGGHGLLAGLGPDHGQHVIFGDELTRGGQGRFGLGFVVLVAKFQFVLLVAHVQATGVIDFLFEHFGGVLRRLAQVRNVTRQWNVKPQFDGVARPGRRGQGKDKKQGQNPGPFHGRLLFAVNFKQLQ